MFDPLLDKFEAMRDGIDLREEIVGKMIRQRLYSELCWGLYAETNPVRAALAQELREDA